MLIKALEKESGFPLVSIHSFDSLPEIRVYNVKLIFFICENSDNQIADLNEFQNFISDFSYIPIIGVIDTSKVHLDEWVINKFIWNFLTIPFSSKDILLIIKRFIPAFNHTVREEFYSSIKRLSAFELFKGESDLILKVKEKILQISSFDVTVLINGETGTGKELCARLIHFLSKRTSNPFVAINCGAFPSELFENELFGHKKGAYTNADENETGLISAANKGTLFLDEIEALNEQMQVKLLRFIEEKKYKPLGQSNYISSDVRIVSAAKENLLSLVEKKKFREDLYYRLNVVNISIPPLRERKEDLSILLDYFFSKYCELYGKNIPGLAPLTVLKFQHHNWPGNIRELENLVQQLVVINTNRWIQPDDINFQPPNFIYDTQFQSFKQNKKHAIESFEKIYLQSVLKLFNGNISHAAKYAKQDRRAFYKLLKKYNMIPSAFKKAD